MEFQSVRANRALAAAQISRRIGGQDSHPIERVRGDGASGAGIRPPMQAGGEHAPPRKLDVGAGLFYICSMRGRRSILWKKAPNAAPAAGFGWAQRLVRRQLDTLARLAAATLRLVEGATRQAADIVALEKAIRLHERSRWALRLIDALRAKLTDDLQRLARGEAPDVVLMTKTPDIREAAPESLAVEPERLTAEKAERAETPDRESLGRCGRLDRDDGFDDILKLPTDEIIALICRELGLPPDWPRLAEQAWESKEMGQALSPLDRGRGGDGGGSLAGKPPDG